MRINAGVNSSAKSFRKLEGKSSSPVALYQSNSSFWTPSPVIVKFCISGRRDRVIFCCESTADLVVEQGRFDLWITVS